MAQARPPKAQARLYALVRDKDGNPKVDNPTSLHPSQIAMLTPDERKALGLKQGDN